MRSLPNFFIKYYWRISFFLLISIGYFFLSQNEAIVNIQLATKTSSTFKLYWATNEEEYSEARSKSIRIFPKVDHYSMKIGDLDHIEKLRIDPMDGKGKIRLISLRIRQKGFKPLIFQKSEDLNLIVADGHIKKKWVDDFGLWVISSGSDPRLHLKFNPSKNPNESKRVYSIYVLFLLLSILPYQRVGHIDFNYVPYMMLFVAVLIGIMASLSRYNKHPDEYVHYQAADYYQHHFKPPEICAPGTEKSYSVYGVSRLNSYEIAHFFAGKFADLWGFLPINNNRRVRYFNVMLWIILTVIAFRSTQSRILFIPLLISPQIWYLFSYCNSDAFALFLIFIVSYLILNDQSLLKRYMHAPEMNLAQIISGIMLGTLFGILFLSKLNYYFFILFLLGWGAIVFFQKRKVPVKQNTFKIVLIVLAAICVIMGRLSYDVYANGFNKKLKIIECREKLAEFIYKPSTPQEKKPVFLNLKDRNISLGEMIKEYDYLSILFRSASGVYGYMEMSAQNAYYRFILIAMLIFLSIGMFYSFYNTPIETKLLALVALSCIVMIIVAAAWFSWTSVFQPQGRYLFPVLPMFGILYYRLRKKIPKAIVTSFVWFLFSISIYSFIWIGLVNIPMV